MSDRAKEPCLIFLQLTSLRCCDDNVGMRVKTPPCLFHLIQPARRFAWKVAPLGCGDPKALVHLATLMLIQRCDFLDHPFTLIIRDLQVCEGGLMGFFCGRRGPRKCSFCWMRRSSLVKRWKHSVWLDVRRTLGRHLDQLPLFLSVWPNGSDQTGFVRQTCSASLRHTSVCPCA